MGRKEGRKGVLRIGKLTNDIQIINRKKHLNYSCKTNGPKKLHFVSRLYFV
jgi:hypothetical protein